MTSIEHYNLGTRFCSQKFKKGGVSIFVHESINFIGVDLQHRCKEQAIEICAVKINLINRNTVTLAVYRAPTGDFDYFLKELEIIFNQLYNIKNDLLICGDFNVNYLEDSKNRQ
jgi:exonuclease III